MRDFNAGRDVHIGRDLVIHDASEPYKPISQHSNEELLAEREHRSGLLREEQHRRQGWQVLGLLIGIAPMLISSAAATLFGPDVVPSNLVWQTIQVGGFMVGLATFLGKARPTEFEQRQQAILNEIAHLLRERRVE